MPEPTVAPAANAHTARAIAATEAAPKYVKQLASHFGHKAEIRTETEGP